jgi:hypothetical protein
MAKKSDLKELIIELVAAQRELDRLMFDEDEPPSLGKPATSQQIATLEGVLGKPLPPSYRAFLELHNGWEDFDGEAKLLAVEDHGSKWVKKRVRELGDLFAETEDDNPFELGAIPLMLGKDTQNYLVLDPRKVRGNGEMDFVTYDLTVQEDRFKDFTAFLADALKVLKGAIKSEKEGDSDDEDEE